MTHNRPPNINVGPSGLLGVHSPVPSRVLLIQQIPPHHKIQVCSSWPASRPVEPANVHQSTRASRIARSEARCEPRLVSRQAAFSSPAREYASICQLRRRDRRNDSRSQRGRHVNVDARTARGAQHSASASLAGGTDCIFGNDRLRGMGRCLRSCWRPLF